MVFEDVTPITTGQLVILAGGAIADGFLGGFVKKAMEIGKVKDSELWSSVVVGGVEVVLFGANRFGKLRLGPKAQNLLSGALLGRSSHLTSGIVNIGEQSMEKLSNLVSGMKTSGAPPSAQFGTAAITQTPPKIIPPQLARGLIEVTI